MFSIEVERHLINLPFYIQISSRDDCISVVCQDCLHLVLNVEKFVSRCIKVQKMFMELAKNCISDESIESLRETYGLSEYEYINCDKNQLEAKPEQFPESGKIYS